MSDPKEQQHEPDKLNDETVRDLDVDEQEATEVRGGDDAPTENVTFNFVHVLK